jgi:TolA-binding protein
MLTRLLMFLVAFLFPGGDDEPDLDTEPADPPADDPPADPDDDEAAGGDDSDLDAEALRKELEKTRREAANRRRQLRDSEGRIETLEEQNKAILQALGIASDEDDDPEARVAALQAENRRLRTRQSFDAIAREAGADEDLTWGYLLARGEIDSLDPDSDDFAETLQASISQALEAKPGLATKPAPPPKGGADLNDDSNPDAVNPEEMDMDDYMKWRAENLDKKD